MNYIIQPSSKSLANADRDTALAVGHACQIVRNAKVGGMAEKDCLLVINVELTLPTLTLFLMPFALTVEVGLPLTHTLVIVFVTECHIIVTVFSTCVKCAVLSGKGLFCLPCL